MSQDKVNYWNNELDKFVADSKQAVNDMVQEIDTQLTTLQQEADVLRFGKSLDEVSGYLEEHPYVNIKE